MSASSSGSARGNQEEPHHAPSSGGWSLPTGRPMAAMLHCRRSVLDADAAPSPEVVALRSRFPSSRAGISFCLSVSVCSELPAMTTFRVRCTGSPLLEWRLFSALDAVYLYVPGSHLLRARNSPTYRRLDKCFEISISLILFGRTQSLAVLYW